MFICSVFWSHCKNFNVVFFSHSDRGKFAQNPDITKTEYVADYNTLISRLTDDRLEMKQVIILNDYLLMIQYKTKMLTQIQTENAVIAAFTTAHARLRLYETMEHIGKYGPDKLLYTDTDSVIYVQRPGEIDPPCGDYLGQLKDEHPGKRIIKYASGGPKNYFYEFEDGSSVTKVKGFTLNFRNSQVITPSLIEDMVRRPDGRKVKITNERKIARSLKHGIVTKQESKHYRVVYTKRVIVGDGLTVPYGFSTSSYERARLKRKAHTLCGRGPPAKRRRKIRREKKKKSHKVTERLARKEKRMRHSVEAIVIRKKHV